MPARAMGDANKENKTEPSATLRNAWESDCNSDIAKTGFFITIMPRWKIMFMWNILYFKHMR